MHTKFNHNQILVNNIIGENHQRNCAMHQCISASVQCISENLNSFAQHFLPQTNSCTKYTWWGTSVVLCISEIKIFLHTKFIFASKLLKIENFHWHRCTLLPSASVWRNSRLMRSQHWELSWNQSEATDFYDKEEFSIIVGW